MEKLPTSLEGFQYTMLPQIGLVSMGMLETLGGGRKLMTPFNQFCTCMVFFFFFPLLFERNFYSIRMIN